MDKLNDTVGSTMDKKVRKVNTKVSARDYQLLLFVCKTYGFRSIYQLLQTLLHCFLRHVDSVRDEIEEDGMAVEISEMFDDMMDFQEQRHNRSQSKGYRNYEK